jgi:PIN domain nuclease of toxin-antitoxin system
MQLVIDTHALAWYLTRDPRLSATAHQHIADPHSILLVPTMVLAELVYLGRRKQAGQGLRDAVDGFLRAGNVQVVGFDHHAVRFLDNLLSIHDAIIVASALSYAERSGEPVKVITKDKQIAASGIVDCIW